jgi:hypothetical protein
MTRREEASMKMRWLWTTWAYVVVVGVIALKLLSVAFTLTFLFPKLQKIKVDGWLEVGDYTETRMAWMFSFLGGLQWTWRQLLDWCVLVLLVLAAAWGLFEWRVRSENKPFIRLAALGTVALGLLVVVVLTAYSLAMPLLMGLPPVTPIAKPYAIQKITSIEESVRVLELAMETNKWDWMQEAANRATHAIDGLMYAAPAIPTAAWPNPKPTVADLRARLKASSDSLGDAQKAIQEKDEDKLKAALQTFHAVFDPISQSAAKPEN